MGYRLVKEGLVYGGSTLTTSDIAVRAGMVKMGDPQHVQSLPESLVSAAKDKMHAMLEQVIDQVKVCINYR